MHIPALRLNNGNVIPAIGYGTSRENDEALEKALDSALKAGYRHIDTAHFYMNEKPIGNVLNRWITEGKLKREEIFLVTKLPPFGNRPAGVKKYLKQSLENLQVEYVDLYLIHGPFGVKDVEEVPHPGISSGNFELDTTDILSVWKEMENQMNAGLAKAIGVSNFNKSQIERLLKNCTIKPSCLQIEIHGYLQQNELVDFCKTNNIIVTAFSPLGSRSMTSFSAKRGTKLDLPDVLSDPTIQKIAKKHSKTEAQVMLRFDIQRGIIPIPKSSNPERMQQNLDIFEFELDEQDLKELKSLDAGIRFFHFRNVGCIAEHPEYPFENKF
ncbi:hypothetical protein WA026_007804 [Henosepilachna vigintioctopunctata]